MPGAKFMPTFRNRVWDGKIRLFSQQTGKIYVGLLPYIKEFCDRNDVEYTSETDVEDDRDIDCTIAKDYITSLKPMSKGKRLSIRDYQSDAFCHAIQRHRCLLVSPTASCKSLIIYALVRYYEMLQDIKILILVPTTS